MEASFCSVVEGYNDLPTKRSPRRTCVTTPHSAAYVSRGPAPGISSTTARYQANRPRQQAGMPRHVSKGPARPARRVGAKTGPTARAGRDTSDSHARPQTLPRQPNWARGETAAAAQRADRSTATAAAAGGGKQPATWHLHRAVGRYSGRWSPDGSGGWASFRAGPPAVTHTPRAGGVSSRAEQWYVECGTMRACGGAKMWGCVPRKGAVRT